MSNIICLIPARYHSTRLPGKPLLKINNKTVIQRTYENVLKSKYFNCKNTIIVTDDDRIIQNINSFNGNYSKITDECINGTERILKLLPKISNKYNIIVNVQGDEPFINPIHIDKCIESYLNISDKDICQYACSTLHYKIIDDSELNNRNVGKAVLDKNNNIIYCSRSMIPHNKKGEKLNIDYFGHIGIFVFNRKILEECFSLENTPNQLSEDIEWLKFIEYGYKIKSSLVDNTEIGINTPEDYQFLIRKYEKSYNLENSDNLDNHITEFKKEMEFQLNNFPYQEIKDLAYIINNYEGNIFTCGIGKSKNVSNNLCELLKSINISCFNICPINSFHGDYGALKKNDIILVLSKSGNTKELFDFCNYAKNKCRIIGIFCNADGLIISLCYKKIILPLKMNLLK